MFISYPVFQRIHKTSLLLKFPVHVLFQDPIVKLNSNSVFKWNTKKVLKLLKRNSELNGLLRYRHLGCIYVQLCSVVIMVTFHSSCRESAMLCTYRNCNQFLRCQHVACLTGKTSFTYLTFLHFKDRPNVPLTSRSVYSSEPSE